MNAAIALVILLCIVAGMAFHQLFLLLAALVVLAAMAFGGDCG
jgi:hypothetical protein